jgi:hypothetical protein
VSSCSIRLMSRTIKPWQPSYKDELATAVSIGASAEDKLKYNLPARFGQGLGIMFDDGEKGRLITLVLADRSLVDWMM